MGLGTSPSLHRFKILPIPPHPYMQRKETKDNVGLVVQQPFRTIRARLLYPRTKPKQGFKPSKRLNSHPEIDNDQIWISGQIYRLSIHLSSHFTLLLPPHVSSLTPYGVRYFCSGCYELANIDDFTVWIRKTETARSKRAPCSLCAQFEGRCDNLEVGNPDHDRHHAAVASF